MPNAERPVLVVGDLICDHYVWGDVERISPEAPVQVLRWAREADRPGGAANVAMNLAALGCRVRVAGVVGADRDGRWLTRALRARGIDTRGILTVRDRPTAQKTRIIARGQHLLRIDREEIAPLNRADERRLVARLGRLLAGVSGVICSDYGKGVLSPPVLSAVLRPSTDRMRGKAIRRPLVLVDPKGHDFLKYRGADILTPNEKELLEATRGAAGTNPDSEQDLARRARWLIRQTGLQALLLTRGAKGMDLFEVETDRAGRRPGLLDPAVRREPDRRPDLQVRHLRQIRRSLRRTHIPVLQKHEVYDVTGAGDTSAAVMGMAVFRGLPFVDAARLANAAAGIVVSSIGTTVVDRKTLGQVTNGAFSPSRSKILSLSALRKRVGEARSHGAKIVFTNGCFDLLHGGHLNLLHRARALGDLLVVGLNDDRSVRRLKGTDRPLMGQTVRAELLASLRFVDYVTLFSDPTPLRLIRTLRPDVLVKGADYALDEVVGRETVDRYGGRVELIPLLPGFSTSALVRAIRHGGPEAAR